jgi:A/G-specific adenine glycosylase
VLSIAYGEPHAVLDGNVARVLARLGAIRGDLRRPKRWRELAVAANALLPAPADACVRGANEVVPAAGAPTTAAGDWNQAMMELGATLCTPRAPQCGACPVSRWCRAHVLGIALRLPARRRKPQAFRLALSAAILLDPRGCTLLLRRKSQHSSLFSSLWQFPAIQSARPAPEKLSRYLKSAFGITAALEPLPPARHTVTFRRILLAPFLARVAKLPAMPGARTPRLAAIDRLPISSATKKIAAAVRTAPAR